MVVGSSTADRLSRKGFRTESTQSTESNLNSQIDQTNQAFQTYQSALSEAVVQHVNAYPNATWSAGMNDYFSGKSYEFLKSSCGTKLDKMKLSSASHNQESVPTTTDTNWLFPTTTQPLTAAFPDKYDVRDKWATKCPSVTDIRDQSGCGSCWAVAAASAMTDRHCIASNGIDRPYISAAEILTCCGQTECGSCQGGYPINAWQFWMNRGVVTGAAFGSSTTCQPYPWAPCAHHVENSKLPQCVAQDTTPQCSQSCSHGRPFDSDKSFGASAYQVASNEAAIMDEILNYGPVEAGFMVYEDFPHYKNGVYKHITGNILGGHAIKLMGWGSENGEKYWVAQNSWNMWGDNGYFKIARGTNECFIEDMVFAGKVKQATNQFIA